MDNILELIRNEEVKWVKLGQLGKFYGGLVGKSKNDFINGNKYYVPYKNVFNNLSVDMNYLEKVQVYDIEKQKKLEVGDIIFTGSSENLKEAGLSSVITEKIEEDIYLNSFCFFYRLNDKNILLPNFSKYLFRSLEIRKQIIKCTAGVTRYNVSKKSMENIQIPIPSLELQEKIVKILDTFTLYQEKIEKELEQRKKQYNYYKDMLLSQDYLLKKAKELCGQDAVVQWEKLGEVCDVRDGTHDSPKRQNNGKYLITSKNVKNGGINFENAYYISEIDYEKINKRSKVDVNDLLFTMIGTIGEIAYITEEPDYAIKNVGLIKTKNLVNQRFIFYCLQSEYTKEYIEKNKSKGTQAFMALGALRNMPFPIPPLEVQECIVNTLYPFYTISYDLKKGLTREIELRKKQYEYYRELLLNFKKTCQEIF